MKNLILSILVLFPVLLFAQAKIPKKQIDTTYTNGLVPQTKYRKDSLASIFNLGNRITSGAQLFYSPTVDSGGIKGLKPGLAIGLVTTDSSVTINTDTAATNAAMLTRLGMTQHTANGHTALGINNATSNDFLYIYGQTNTSQDNLIYLESAGTASGRILGETKSQWVYQTYNGHYSIWGTDNAGNTNILCNDGAFNVASFSSNNILTATISNSFVGVNVAAPNSFFQVNGSFATAYVAKSGAYTATASDCTIDCTTGTFTVTMPTAVGITGRIYVVRNSGAGVITLATTSSQPITTTTLATGTVAQLQSTGAGWIKIN